MPCDSELLKGIAIFELLHDDDRLELAKVVDSVRAATRRSTLPGR